LDKRTLPVRKTSNKKIFVIFIRHKGHSVGCFLENRKMESANYELRVIKFTGEVNRELIPLKVKGNPGRGLSFFLILL